MIVGEKLLARRNAVLPVGGHLGLEGLAAVRSDEADVDPLRARAEAGDHKRGVDAGQAGAELVPDHRCGDHQLRAERIGRGRLQRQQPGTRETALLQLVAHLQVTGHDDVGGHFPGDPSRSVLPVGLRHLYRVRGMRAGPAASGLPLGEGQGHARAEGHGHQRAQHYDETPAPGPPPVMAVEPQADGGAGHGRPRRIGTGYRARRTSLKLLAHIRLSPTAPRRVDGAGY